MDHLQSSIDKLIENGDADDDDSGMFSRLVLSPSWDVFSLEQGKHRGHNMRGLWWPVAHQLLKQATTVTLPRRFLPEARRRFYKNVTVAGNGGIYEVNLDLHKLKTPMGHILQIPNYGLALAVAQEWATTKDRIFPSLMHLTGLSYTVIDNPSHETKWDTVDKTLDYLDTDTLLFREEGTEELNTLQAKEWDPILEWFNQKFEVDIKPCPGLFGADIPAPARETIRRYLLSYDGWAVNGFIYGVEALKSVILTIAAAERKITAEKAAFLSRLELEYQTSRWGSVEWAHDLDKQEVEARFSAALMFIHFNTWQATTKHKAM